MALVMAAMPSLTASGREAQAARTAVRCGSVSAGLAALPLVAVQAFAALTAVVLALVAGFVALAAALAMGAFEDFLAVFFAVFVEVFRFGVSFGVSVSGVCSQLIDVPASA